MGGITKIKSLLLCAAFLLIFIGTTAETQARLDLFETFGSDFFTCDHFSNSLFGMHDRLEEKYGLSFEILYFQDFFWNTHGGINTHDSGEYPRLMGLYMELDTAKAGLWENGTFFLGLEHVSGRNPSETQVGDWQWFSWISGDRKRNQISEFWYKHSFLDGTWWVKLGKMEANYDFNYIEYSLEFVNSSAALNPTLPVPSYPLQDWGAVVGVKPADWFSCNVGIYQGKIEGSRSIGNTLDDLRGPMLIAEPSFKYALGGLPGQISIGAWWNGRRFEAYHEHSSHHRYHGKSAGFYGFWHQLVWKENPQNKECAQGIGMFAEYGWTPKDRSEVEDYVGGGIQWTGAIPTRNDDILGLGAFNVYFSDQAGFDEDYETAIEFFYKAQLFGWMAIKPDIQYIINPGGTKNGNALALGGRLEVVF